VSTRRPRPKRKTPPTKPADAERIKLELEIHREELATQNEDLRRANAALAAANERYALLYDRAPIGYFTVAAEGTLVEVNVVGAALVGLGRPFLFGRPFDELLVASSRAAFRQFRERVLEQGVPSSHETVLASARGPVPVRIDAAPLLGGANPGQECILCVTDESQRRELEAQRRRSQAAQAETDRLKSLGRLAGGVAHDFNNILSIIIVRAELLLLEERQAESVLDHAREIREAAARAAALSQQMMAYTGHSRSRFAPVDLSQVVRTNVPLLERLAPACSLRFELGDRLPSFEGDPVQIAQMLSNLVTNAVEAIERGGSILVRTDHREGAVVLEVIDDGRGMDEGTRLHAFDPFYTTKFAGRGLGLAVVYGHALAHRATVSIESRPHQGATLRIVFPALGPPLDAANDVADEDLPAARGLVLVVDDEDGVRTAASRLLERLGFGVVSARDGIEGLSVLRAPPEPIVAVLLDLTMPRLDGSEMLRQLRERWRVPVLLMSGYSERALDDELLALADGFVAKPFTIAVLRRALARALRSHRNREAG
jgi:PAS domain S-box-containing protein